MPSILTRRCAALLVAAALTSLTTPLAAQPTGSVPAQRGPDARAAVENRIAELHSRLRITAAQQAQWDALTQVMRENAAHMRQVVAEHGRTQNMSALDDLRAYASVTQAHAEDMQRLVPAFQTLYEAMSPEQQQVADTTFRQFQHNATRRAGKP